MHKLIAYVNTRFAPLVLLRETPQQNHVSLLVPGVINVITFNLAYVIVKKSHIIGHFMILFTRGSNARLYQLKSHWTLDKVHGCYLDSSAQVHRGHSGIFFIRETP